MFTGIKRILRDSVTLWGFITALLALVGLGVFIFASGQISESGVALHYNIYFGTDVFGAGSAFLWGLAAGLMVYIVNLVIATFTIERQLLAARLLAWSSFVFVGIVFATTILYTYYRPL